jgi:hypothetical protein
MVARRRRHDAPATLVVAELREEVVRAANLNAPLRCSISGFTQISAPSSSER